MSTIRLSLLARRPSPGVLQGRSPTKKTKKGNKGSYDSLSFRSPLSNPTVKAKASHLDFAPALIHPRLDFATALISPPPWFAPDLTRQKQSKRVQQSRLSENADLEQNNHFPNDIVNWPQKPKTVWPKSVNETVSPKNIQALGCVVLKGVTCGIWILLLLLLSCSLLSRTAPYRCKSVFQ